jgi:hypothetical protein|tara:strand:- start:1969 stop:2616 length:648 start_codon:yes stop_codon:yes gene_type:complete
MRTLQRYTTENVTELKEGAVSRVADLFYAFRFLRLLTMPWEKTTAFKLNLIDKDGKRLKAVKVETPGQKSAYTVFHRLVFNVKRLIQKIPGVGKTTVAKYAAALYLIKEHTHMSEKQIKKIMDQVELDLDWDNLPIQESKWFINIRGDLNPGTYMLVNDIASIDTGEMVAFANSKITTLSQHKTPYDTFLGESIYKVYHPKTNQHIFITNGDIMR